MSRESIKQKLKRLNAQLEDMEYKKKELLRQLQEAEDAESLKILKRHKISSEQLQLLNKLSEEEISLLLEEKKKVKEALRHEETIL